MSKADKEKEKHYVNNAEFLEHMKVHIKAVNIAKKKKSPLPQVSNYIGECIVSIANKLANKPNFVNYPFRDEMICDGIENCLQYLNNFNPEKSSNPFAYFTQIIYFAFVRRIQKEKKQLYAKYKLIEQSLMHDIVEDEHLQNTKYGSDESDLNMHEFIQNFEKSRDEKKKKSKNIREKKSKEKVKTKTSTTKVKNELKTKKETKLKTKTNVKSESKTIVKGKKRKLSFDEIYEEYKHLPEQ